MLMTMLRLLAVLSAFLGVLHAADRPSILWITCEDTNALLGAYGDRLARTPNLDGFARQGVRYDNAFAYTGVCAPSRSSLITGVNPSRLGSGGMRSSTRLPGEVKAFTEYLREAGYYTSNNVKTDYNFPVPKTAWDESSNRAHWKNRAPGQPFFSVFNIMVTHQSFIFGPGAGVPASQGMPPLVTDPAKVTIPPIHPDLPEFRQEWARHYDNVARMDTEVGRILAELDAAGLTEDTIVFFFSDHGTGLPSIKGSVWNMSLRVPFMVRFPEKWRHLAPAQPGAATDRLVTFIDFAPTVLSLAGLVAPVSQQGVAFLGEHAGAPRTQVHGGKDRMIERPDLVRYGHDGRFQYLRNFLPHLPYGQFISYNDQHASMRAWERRHKEGSLSPDTDRFFQTKPVEELYDVVADPWCLNNLADDPRHRERLLRMREDCLAWMLETGDLGLLPEHEMFVRSEGRTPWELAIDPRGNPMRELLDAAELSGRRDPQTIPELRRLLKKSDAALRWWGVNGFLGLEEKSSPAMVDLAALLRDSSPSVRIAAAEVMLRFGTRGDALQVLIAALEHESALVRLAALNALDRSGQRARPALPAIAAAKLEDKANSDAANYVGRMVDYLPGRIGH